MGSIGETIKKFAESAVGVGVADADGVGAGAADAEADGVGAGVVVAETVGVGVAVQIFLFPDFMHLKVLLPTTFLAPICLQGDPFLIVAASAGAENAVSNAAITSAA